MINNIKIAIAAVLLLLTASVFAAKSQCHGGAGLAKSTMRSSCGCSDKTAGKCTTCKPGQGGCNCPSTKKVKASGSVGVSKSAPHTGNNKPINH